MTSDQLKQLMKVLDTGSTASIDENDRVRSSEWRREKVHTTPVSLGSLIRDSGDGSARGD